MTPQLPISFCWSKFGDEAGEESDFIIARKELERVKNDVYFFGVLVQALDRHFANSFAFKQIQGFSLPQCCRSHRQKT